MKKPRKLPPAEQQLLRAALTELASNGDGQPAYRTHERERAWINEHRDEYLGQWVALDGDHLLAHGADARQVFEEARAQGFTAPYLERVSPKQEAFMGGWQ